MRIISDFHDYYDVGMQNGVDPQLPYRRFRREEPVLFPRGNWKSVGNKLMVDEDYRILYFGFAGKVYPRMETSFNMTDVVEPTFCFDPTRLDDSFFVDRVKKARWTGKNLQRAVKREKVRVFEYFEFKDAPELLDLFEQFKTAIFVYQKGNNTIIINERLNLYGFQKVLPPMEAFQELAMYVGAYLTKPVIEEPPISDTIKAEIHGFDKFSFRKEKQKK